MEGFNIIYKWFDFLKSQVHFIYAFIIMPNNVHAIISFIETVQVINKIIGNVKGFMAYDIIKKLKEKEDFSLRGERLCITARSEF